MDHNSKELIEKKFTLATFLKNPTGDKGTNSLMRTAVLEKYLESFYKFRKEGKKFKLVPYLIGKELYLHIQVPSDKFVELTYDVVLCLDGYDKNITDLTTLDLKFFSNSPSFTFTFANVFDGFKIIIPFLKVKYDTKVFKQSPVVRNPDYSTFYEKSLALAILYLRESNLFSNADLKNIGITKATKSQILDKIATAESKVKLYSDLSKKQTNSKKNNTHGIDDLLPESQKKNLKKKLDKNKSNKVDSTVKNRVSNKVNSKLNMKAKMNIK